VAAFDHRHVFLDPSPDTEKSFKERERLFNLPRSSWADYNAKLISKGGGVFPRSAKSISLSPEIQKTLGSDAKALAPNELISAILQAPVALLNNGGIGTYVKPKTQSHAAVGDRANDAIRVNGADLRCKVVAEGGNLGFTQLGRIEFALAGGRINTDAIDNSAGVSCSDHEVNIKILLNAPVREGKLTYEQRNKLLADMTDEVAALVLRDNYYKTQIHAHPLRREIIATHVTNSMINRVGSTFVHRLQDETGAAAPDVVRAYLITREAFGLVELWQAVEALDYKVPDRIQTAMVIDAGRLILRASLWFLRNRSPLADLSRSIEHFRARAKRVAALFPQVLPEAEQTAFQAAAGRLEKEGVPRELAARIAATDALFNALDIVEVSDQLKRDIEPVARLHFALAGDLDLPWLRSHIGMLSADNHWQTLAKAALRDDLASMLRALSADALRASASRDDASSSDPAALISAWKTRNSVLYERFRQVLADLRSSESADLAMLSVAM